MGLKIPGLEIREPLAPRPITGGVVGALAGAMLGGLVLFGYSTAGMSADRLFLGYVAGFTAGGVVVGGALPLMRHRVLAGLVAAVAVSIGFGFATRVWEQSIPIAVVVVVGVLAGILYAWWWWDYRPDPDQGR